MSHARYSSEEIARRGAEIYEHQLRSRLEPGNQGKYLVIDIETGEYELSEDRFSAADRMLSKNPDGARFAMRIGRRTVGRIGRSRLELRR
jgi:hypothetical protein